MPPQENPHKPEKAPSEPFDLQELRKEVQKQAEAREAVLGPVKECIYKHADAYPAFRTFITKFLGKKAPPDLNKELDQADKKTPDKGKLLVKLFLELAEPPNKSLPKSLPVERLPGILKQAIISFEEFIRANERLFTPEDFTKLRDLFNECAEAVNVPQS